MKGARADWLLRHRLPLSIVGLSVALLSALVASAVIMALEFRANRDRIDAATQRFERLQVADAVQRDFGEMRYWLTELSVSLLTLSERRAEAAQDGLAGSLGRLRGFAPGAAADIEAAADAFWRSGIDAVDEYTAGNRVVGNMLVAEARRQGEAVDATIAALIDDLSDTAVAANARAGEAAAAAQRRALVACALIVLAGLGATALLLRSILGPLRRIDGAMADLRAERAPRDLPEEGPDEFGRMATTLRELHEAQVARRRLEAAAAEQRRTIVTAIETIPQGFALFDADDRLVLRNERLAQMFPGIAGAPAGATFEALAQAGLEAGARDRAGRVARHRDPRPGRDEIPGGDGWLAVTKRRTPDGGTVAVYDDVTEARAHQGELDHARREAEAASVAKSRFLASMSHELRTPLNAIIGYGEMLIEDAEDSGDGGEAAATADLQRITSAGKHLLSLINDVLDLSKIEAGKMDVLIEEVDVAETVEDVRLTVAPLVAANGNVLEVDVEPGIGAMRTDRTKLRQNLFNLLSNAAKFTEGGRIALEARGEGGDVLFVVADSGIGMSDAQMERIFQPFAQAEASTAGTYGGTGLGLSLVRQFSEMLGGTVEVASRPGEGARFSMRLPRGAAAAPAAAPAPEAGAGAMRALVIDDDPSARERLAEAVRAAGYAPLVASDAEAGLALARAHRPDVVLLDIIMPGRDGWSVLRELKRDPMLCETPVVVVSMITDGDMGRALGASDVLLKPVTAEQLSEALGDVMSEGAREALVVDDDPATRALFRRVLARAGWSVREASDGERALALVAERMPDLVVLDLLMPGLDGFATLERLRAGARTQALPVIVATSKDLTAEERRFLGGNAAEVVAKGASGRADLMAAIARHVAPPAPPAPVEPPAPAEPEEAPAP